MRLIITLFIIFYSTISLAQSVVSLTGQIKDAKTDEFVGYVRVYSKLTKRTILSNERGIFHFKNIPLNDTLVFACIGYERINLSYEEIIRKDRIIKIESKNNILKDVEIYASDQLYLAKLLNESSKKASKLTQTSKVYYDLKSFHEKQQIELLQGFYNADIKGYNIEDLKFKAGRIGLQEFDNRIFVSLQTSLSIILMDLLEVSNYFPNQPLQYSTSKILKKFDLKLVDKYAEDKDTVFVIKYSPKQAKNSYFTGKIWVKEESKQILKIELACIDAHKHPFIPIFPDDEILKVDFSITRTFIEIDNQMFWDKTYFDYDINYRSNNSGNFNINTAAVLYAYDFENSFFIPEFNFVRGESDYRKISAFPHNEWFWKEIAPNQIIDSEGLNDQFLENENTKVKDNVFNQSKIRRRKFYESPYVSWTGKRILWRDLQEKVANTSGGIQYNVNKGSVHNVANDYNLEVQLYFDINDSTNNLVQTRSAIIFDPFYSYFNIEVTPKELCFINVYFDLMEIERRKMDEKIAVSDHEKNTVLEIYFETKKSMTELAKLYVSEVFHGLNKDKMIKWNAVVLNELKIDNFAIFEPFPVSEE